MSWGGDPICHRDGASVRLSPALPLVMPSLDGMRALSILLVLFAHAATTQGAPLWMDKPAFVSLGNVGVRFFFLISGFLITTLLLRELEAKGRIDLKAFFVRRAYRILPALLVYIGVIWLLYLAGVLDLRYRVLSQQTSDSAIPDLLHALSFTVNYQHDYNWYFNHLWSLSVEEQFYLLWPLALVGLGLARARWFALAVLFVAPACRLLMHTVGWGPEIALSREFQAVADALATGCLGAIWHQRLSGQAWFARLVRGPAVPLGGLLIAVGYGVALVYRPAAYVAGQTAANFGILLLLLHLVGHPGSWLGRCANLPLMARVGALSYSLYLWQEPFLFFKSEAWLTRFPLNLLWLTLAALLSYHLVEQPFLRLKARRAQGLLKPLPTASSSDSVRPDRSSP
jgi:peptidoglycan/LPS O-acetylase OafA/YrhL